MIGFCSTYKYLCEYISFLDQHIVIDVIAMSLLKLKIDKLRNQLNNLDIDVDLAILKSSNTLKYMVSELYSPPPEEIPASIIIVDFQSNNVEMYVKVLDAFRAQETYGTEGIEVYAISWSCTDVAQDIKCIDKSVMDNVIKDKMSKYKYVAVDDISICKDALCIDIRKVIKDIRRSKSAEEVEIIKRAVSVAEKAVHSISSKIRYGISEADIASMLEYAARGLGAEGFAFNTIVAIGENTAKPHHVPTTRALKSREPILIDFGVRISGYVSDITRVLVPINIDKEYKELLELIETASARALSVVREGIPCRCVDDKARATFKVKDLHKHFLHGVGHGIGVDVHEEPRLSQDSSDTLIHGDTITIEPGLYIRGKYGVRLEDVVYVDRSEGKVLSTGPKVIEL